MAVGSVGAVSGSLFDDVVFVEIFVGPAGMPLGIAADEVTVADHVASGAPLDIGRMAHVLGQRTVHEAVKGALETDITSPPPP